MNKNYFMPGSDITAEEKEAIRVTLKQKQKDDEQLLAKLSELKNEKLKNLDFMNPGFNPFEDRILVYPDPVKEKTAGGIFKPSVAIEKVKPMMGTVVCVGPGKAGVTYRKDNVISEELPIKVGMRITYGNYAGTEITLKDVKYLIMRVADCFGELK